MKFWYQSLTVWFNIGLALVDMVNQFAQIGLPIPHFLFLGVGVIGIILRTITSQQIVFKTPPDTSLSPNAP